MRIVPVSILACLALGACGSTHKTVVVNPPPHSVVVVDSNGQTHVIRQEDNSDRYDYYTR